MLRQKSKSAKPGWELRRSYAKEPAMPFFGYTWCATSTSCELPSGGKRGSIIIENWSKLRQIASNFSVRPSPPRSEGWKKGQQNQQYSQPAVAWLLQVRKRPATWYDGRSFSASSSSSSKGANQSAAYRLLLKQWVKVPTNNVNNLEWRGWFLRGLFSSVDGNHNSI